MKYILLTTLFLIASCASVERKEPPEMREVSKNAVIYSYPIIFIQDPSLLPRIIKKAAILSHEKGYSNFLIYRESDLNTRFELVIFMFNEEVEIPIELSTFERFNAEEYMHKEYVPLGLIPNAA